ncbi:unnamed protein product, partial [Prorocentrum cordatum]
RDAVSAAAVAAALGLRSRCRSPPLAGARPWSRGARPGDAAEPGRPQMGDSFDEVLRRAERLVQSCATWSLPEEAPEAPWPAERPPAREPQPPPPETPWPREPLLAAAEAPPSRFAASAPAARWAEPAASLSGDFSNRTLSFHALEAAVSRGCPPAPAAAAAGRGGGPVDALGGAGLGRAARAGAAGSAGSAAGSAASPGFFSGLAGMGNADAAVLVDGLERENTLLRQQLERCSARERQVRAEADDVREQLAAEGQRDQQQQLSASASIEAEGARVRSAVQRQSEYAGEVAVRLEGLRAEGERRSASLALTLAEVEAVTRDLEELRQLLLPALATSLEQADEGPAEELLPGDAPRLKASVQRLRRAAGQLRPACEAKFETLGLVQQRLRGRLEAAGRPEPSPPAAPAAPRGDTGQGGRAGP